MAASGRQTHLLLSLNTSRSTRFFNPDNLAKELFIRISDADYSSIETILDNHPELMFRQITIETTAGQTRKISPLQRAFHLLDSTTWKSFLHRIESHKPYLDLFHEQAHAQQHHINLSPLFECYQAYLLEVARWEQGLVMASSVESKWNRIGPAQFKYLPKHMLKEFCHEGSTWKINSTFDTSLYSRSGTPKIYHSELNQYIPFTRSTDCFQKEQLTLIRGHNYGVARFSKGDFRTRDGFFASLSDHQILKYLFEARKSEFDALIQAPGIHPVIQP